MDFPQCYEHRHQLGLDDVGLVVGALGAQQQVVLVVVEGPDEVDKFNYTRYSLDKNFDHQLENT